MSEIEEYFYSKPSYIGSCISVFKLWNLSAGKFDIRYLWFLGASDFDGPSYYMI